MSEFHRRHCLLLSIVCSRCTIQWSNISSILHIVHLFAVGLAVFGVVEAYSHLISSGCVMIELLVPEVAIDSGISVLYD